MKHPFFRSFMLGLVLTAVVSGFFAVAKQFEFSVSANSAIRGIAGDRWADIVLGQPNFQEGMINERVNYRANLPGGVHVDRSTIPNRLYVYDSGNSRILGYSSLGTCKESLAPCTTNSDCANGLKCNLTPNKPASLVLGQSNFSSGSCNKDANYSDFPTLATASASSLCTMEPDEISPLEAGSYGSMDTDADGNLYAADWQNNRVLRYDDPFAPGINSTGADGLIGQTQFTDSLCNRGSANPSAVSLCLSKLGGSPTNPGSNYSFSASVDIDGSGNLWVVDSHNHRVLRFPNVNGSVQTTADLVLGQASFTTRFSGSSLNRFELPEAVEVDAQGNVYVADGPNNHRVLKFTAPLTNGMFGQVWGSGFVRPTAIELDPSNQAMWVSDNDKHVVAQFNLAGTIVQKLLYKDLYNGAWPPVAPCLSSTGCWMVDTRGSIGLTSDGDVWLSGSEAFQDVLRFPGPIAAPMLGSLAKSDYSLFSSGGEHNLLTSRSFASPAGVVLAEGQLIVSDRGRLLFWNNPSSLTNWQSALGAAGTTSPAPENPEKYGRMIADENGHLYVIHANKIEIFQLPLSMGEMPIVTLPNTLQDLEGNTIDLLGFEPFGTGGLATDAEGDYLWFTQTQAHRVLRIRHPLTAPVVDVVIGQLDADDSGCNLSGHTQVQDYDLRRLCHPGGVSLDNLGNLYVSDATIESVGNKRLMIWSASSLPTNNTQTLYAPVAHRYGLVNTGPLQVAFDSQNRAVVGFNDYQDLSVVNPRHSLVAFDNLYDSDAHTEFMEYMVMPYSIQFDSQDNLYVSDMNRFRVLKYLQPLGGPLTD